MVQVLQKLVPFPHPWVDLNVGPMEDAAVLRPPNGPAMVFTVDFITPIVDDPETFGAIAAANALSDVYAMGGTPTVALAICGFPQDKVPLEILERIFKGGRDKCAEAGCAIVGGHTVVDPELKYGLCVLGVLSGESSLAQTNAKPGDKLILTKPIGTGIAAQAIKNDHLSPQNQTTVINNMLTLNAAAKDAALAAGAHAATDVTGFGLLGHLYHLLIASKLSARIHLSAVPVYDFVRSLAAQGLIPGGTKKNLAYVAPHTAWPGNVDPIDQLILCDAQTSGGLLIAVAADKELTFVAELQKRGVVNHACVGEITNCSAGQIEVCP